MKLYYLQTLILLVALSSPASAQGRRTGWPLSGYDVAATGFNSAERRLNRENVQDLTVEWTFNSAVAGRDVRAIHATPVVDKLGNTYVGDFAGTFFAVSSRGQLKWAVETDAPTPELAALVAAVTGTSAVTPIIGGAALSPCGRYVVFGDANGRIYARNRRTGAEVWTARGIDANPLGGVSGNSLSIVNDVVLVGLSSLENYAFVLASSGLPLNCCSHRGSVVALDLNTGAVLWRRDVVEAAKPLPPERAPFLLGPSGADIWAQPAYDAETHTVFVSTGQNLSPTADGLSTPTSDAIIALDATTGQELWVHQFTENDIWAVGVVNPDPVTGQPLDMDLGDAPKVYRLRDGRKVVGAGQKDGRYHVLDAITGALVNTAEVIPPRNDLGGFQTGGAFAYHTAFQHGLAATDGFSDCNEGTCPYEGFDGTIVALTDDGSDVLWKFTRPVSPLVGGLAVANHVLYFQSPVDEAQPLVDEPSWGLYALDTDNGAVRKHLSFPGRAIGSPVVADSKVYVTTGNLALTMYGSFPEGSLIRLRSAACDD